MFWRSKIHILRQMSSWRCCHKCRYRFKVKPALKIPIHSGPTYPRDQVSYSKDWLLKTGSTVVTTCKLLMFFHQTLTLYEVKSLSNDHLPGWVGRVASSDGYYREIVLYMNFVAALFLSVCTCFSCASTAIVWLYLPWRSSFMISFPVLFAQTISFWCFMISLCFREIDAMTGSWFYSRFRKSKRNAKTNKIISGNEIVRASIRRRHPPPGRWWLCHILWEFRVKYTVFCLISVPQHLGISEGILISCSVPIQIYLYNIVCWCSVPRSNSSIITIVALSPSTFVPICTWGMIFISQPYSHTGCSFLVI